MGALPQGGEGNLGGAKREEEAYRERKRENLCDWEVVCVNWEQDLDQGKTRFLELSCQERERESSCPS